MTSDTLRDTRRAPARPVAFFDVDETLLSVRTLESFLYYYRARTPGWLGDEQLRDLAAGVETTERAAFNAAYYRLWAGQPVARVLQAGEDWYREASQAPGFFRANVVERLASHRRSGARIVLVSGSFPAPLAPLARQVRADKTFCTRLEVTDGRYTGMIIEAMTGTDKRRAIEAYLAPDDPPPQTWGYGDHVSDLGLLEAVRHPVVVGDDPALSTIARRRDWPIMSIDTPLKPRR